MVSYLRIVNFIMAARLAILTFEANDEVESYLERLSCYFDVAGTEDDKVPALLMVLSAAQYQALKDLVSPAVPCDVAFATLRTCFMLVFLLNLYLKLCFNFRTVSQQFGVAMSAAHDTVTPKLF